MNRQVGLCYSLCVGIVIFFAVALRPRDDVAVPRPTPARKVAKARVETKSALVERPVKPR